MRRFFVVILAVIIIVTILILIYNPDLLENIWLWIVGLIGPIIGFTRESVKSISNLVSGEKNIPKKESQKKPADISTEKEEKYTLQISNLKKEISSLEKTIDKAHQVQPPFEGITITVLRYFDDNETTLGLLFINSQFFCYTLEDTFQEIKIKGKTRIPAGTYELDFYNILTPLTKTYRENRPWFDYHLEIKNVTNFSNVYIHNGSSHEHTKGCLIIADSIYSSNEKRILFNSKKTFEKFYKKIGNKLKNEIKVRIKIFDENWFEKSKLKNYEQTKYTS